MGYREPTTLKPFSSLMALPRRAVGFAGKSLAPARQLRRGFRHRLRRRAGRHPSPGMRRRRSSGFPLTAGYHVRCLFAPRRSVLVSAGECCATGIERQHLVARSHVRAVRPILGGTNLGQPAQDEHPLPDCFFSRVGPRPAVPTLHIRYLVICIDDPVPGRSSLAATSCWSG